MGASCAVLDTVKTKEANMLKMLVFRKEWDDFCLLGVPLGASCGVLGASWSATITIGLRTKIVIEIRVAVEIGDRDVYVIHR